MIKEILSILDEYENKPADFEFVRDILFILRKYYHCEDYLKKVLVYRYNTKNKEEKYFDGLYNSHNKSIYIDISALDKYDITQLDKNIGILVIILHEFAHVTQEKRHNNKLQNRLLEISNHAIIKERIGELHDYIPDERLANIKSVMWCINILSENFLKYHDQIFRKKRMLYNYLIDGYAINECSLSYPLETFFKETNQYEENKELIEYGKELSYPERLLYGFPISKNEYGELKDICDDYRKQSKNKSRLKIIIE